MGTQFSDLANSEEIVNSVMDVYYTNFPNIEPFYRLHDGFLSLKEPLQPLVPALSGIPWLIDKEEISRTWNALIVLPPQSTPEDFIRHLGEPKLTNLCVEIPLDPRYFTRDPVLIEYPTPPEPVLLNRIRAPNLTQEVKISTIWTNWYCETDDYIRRFRITKLSKISGVFVSQSEVSPIGMHFSLTWMPHYHSKGKVWEETFDGKGMGFTEKPLACLGSSATVNAAFDVKCLLWNCPGASGFSFEQHVANLIGREKPHMFIVTDTRPFGQQAENVSRSLGFAGVFRVEDRRDYGGIWILGTLSS